MPGPVLWGPGTRSNNLQGSIGQSTGQTLAYNGPKNYIGFNDAETGLTTGWVLGNVPSLSNGFPSSNSPTFGSGASVNLTLGTVTSGQLAGTTSYSYISSAATVAGDLLASQAYTIDAEDQAKVMTFKFYYSQISGSGNFSGTSSNSFGVAIWDVTNSVWIQPAGCFGMTQNSAVGYCTGTWQTPSNMTQFRLVVYNATATGAAISMYFDDFYCGPQTAPIGSPKSDLQTYTMTIGGSTTAPTLGTVTTNSATWSRDGQFAEIFYTFSQTVAGVAGSGFYKFPLPPGLTANTSLVTLASDVTVNTVTKIGTIVGRGKFGSTSTGDTNFNTNATVFMFDSTTMVVNVDSGSAAAASYPLSSSSAQSFGNTNFWVTFNVRVPISGWSSNVQMSNDTDTRVIASSYFASASFTGGATIPFNFDSKEYDINSAVTPSPTAWKYTAQISGLYEVTGMIGESTGTAGVILYKNGTAYKSIGLMGGTGALSPNISGTVMLNAGDFIDVRPSAGATMLGGALGSASTSTINIKRITGPAVVAATESVNMKYTNTAGTSIANTGDNNVPFATKVYDSHNAYNTSTGIYTVPVSGKYSVNGTVNYTSATYGVNNQVIASVYKNGAIDSYGDIAPIMAIVTLPFGSVVDTTVSCNAGDTLEVRAQNTRTAGATTLNTGAGFNHIEIARIGN